MSVWDIELDHDYIIIMLFVVMGLVSGSWCTVSAMSLIPIEIAVCGISKVDRWIDNDMPRTSL